MSNAVAKILTVTGIINDTASNTINVCPSIANLSGFDPGLVSSEYNVVNLFKLSVNSTEGNGSRNITDVTAVEAAIIDRD